MRKNIFGGAVLGLLCLSATSFADWNATDKALGHEGKTFYGRNTYSQYSQQQTYRAAPVVAYRVAPAPVIVSTPAAVPQVAATNTNTERRSFSVEPSAAPVMNNNNAVYSAPRFYNNNVRVQHQPNYSQADTKILGREGR